MLEPVHSWGRFTRYLEIGDDSYATRQVDQFDNGFYLRYERNHWCDGYGMLADMRYVPKKWEKFWGKPTIVTLSLPTSRLSSTVA